jgi:hypothetical protein
MGAHGPGEGAGPTLHLQGNAPDIASQIIVALTLESRTPGQKDRERLKSAFAPAKSAICDSAHGRIRDFQRYFVRNMDGVNYSFRLFALSSRKPPLLRRFFRN